MDTCSDNLRFRKHPVYNHDQQFKVSVGFRRQEETDPVLVKQNDEGAWKPVEEFEPSGVHRDEVGEKYALWTDKEVTAVRIDGNEQKPLMVREKDGLIQKDELQHLDFQFLKDGWQGRGQHSLFVGAELLGSNLGPVGAGVGHLWVFYLPADEIVKEGDQIHVPFKTVKEAMDVRQNDNLWHLASNPSS